MFPQFFEVWNNGKVALQRQWVLELGKSVRGTKKDETKEEDYVLVELSQIDFRCGKSLDNRIVIIQDKPDGAGSKKSHPQNRETQATQKDKSQRTSDLH